MQAKPPTQNFRNFSRKWTFAEHVKRITEPNPRGQQS